MIRRYDTLLRLCWILAVLGIAGASLSACGKRGAPLDPDGSTYKHTYPRE
ncbi:hypothetical protein HEQ62_05570 [Haematospirillum jordaniae]|nr:hypothetical protein [Haematospirillum jordaniae]NKD44656.1 hypothetical protein [Haematospirillum jordaniae]NKD57676.1 hypothetical protein [Haematospirillum jordaniae]NKD59246.1 hypothetical protein [Haematospirillum jordaniae]NKD67384.1 hypothetical protein [Haematospirillum jordaniae]NKD79475.1 hypothetical protein [Haematospirillum jordaniae]